MLLTTLSCCPMKPCFENLGPGFQRIPFSFAEDYYTRSDERQGEGTDIQCSGFRFRQTGFHGSRDPGPSVVLQTQVEQRLFAHKFKAYSRILKRSNPLTPGTKRAATSLFFPLHFGSISAV